MEQAAHDFILDTQQVCASERSAAATGEKRVRFGITACAQGIGKAVPCTLGLSALPNRTRFSQVPHQSLPPRRVPDRCLDVALTTVRPEGYPQATTVSHAHEGLTISIGVGRNSQKAANIGACDKGPFTISPPYSDKSRIQGLSAAASARILEWPEDIEQAGNCLLRRFPQVGQWADQARSGGALLLEIRPRLISLLDYRKGFGLTEPVNV